jgi:hypothetical protein
MASIVQRLNNRSISGRGLGTDLHKYDGQLLLLLWKERGLEQCYTHVLERKFLEFPEYTLLQNHMYHSGFPGMLACLSPWLPGKWNFPPCPFLVSGPSRHTLARRYPSSSPARDFFYPNCKCPVVSSYQNKTTALVSIFCINRHRKFTSKVPHSPQDWIWSRHELDPASRTLNL